MFRVGREWEYPRKLQDDGDDDDDCDDYDY